MFACTLFVRMRTVSHCFLLRYCCVYGRRARLCVYAIRAYICGRIALVCVNAIREDADEYPVSACRLLVPSGRIARYSVYAIRADSDEYPVFACTIFVRKRTNSPCLQDRYSCMQTIRPCLRLCYSCVYVRVALVWVYVITADAVE